MKDSTSKSLKSDIQTQIGVLWQHTKATLSYGVRSIGRPNSDQMYGRVRSPVGFDRAWYKKSIFKATIKCEVPAQ